MSPAIVATGIIQVKPSIYSSFYITLRGLADGKTASCRVSDMRSFYREVRAISTLHNRHGAVNRQPRSRSSSLLFLFTMSDEGDDYENFNSDDDDCVDPLFDAYRNMQSMFDEQPFQGYDADFDAYDAKDSNLDAAVAAWYAALQKCTDGDQRSNDAFSAALNIAEAGMKTVYASTLRTQVQQNNRRRSS